MRTKVSERSIKRYVSAWKGGARNVPYKGGQHAIDETAKEVLNNAVAETEGKEAYDQDEFAKMLHQAMMDTSGRAGRASEKAPSTYLVKKWTKDLGISTTKGQDKSKARIEAENDPLAFLSTAVMYYNVFSTTPTHELVANFDATTFYVGGFDRGGGLLMSMKGRDKSKAVQKSVPAEYKNSLKFRWIPITTAGGTMSEIIFHFEWPELPPHEHYVFKETGDYVQFREMMMFTKRKREESKTGDEGDMVGLVADSRQGVAAADADVAGMMDLCAALSEGAQSTDSWETVLENDWMKIDKMAVPESNRRKKSDIYLRGVWTMNLNMVEACDMMFTLNGRRKGWDPNFTSVSFPNGGSDRDDDVVTSVALNFGYLINLVMFGSGSGTQLIARNIRKWGVPTPRSVTYAMVPWNIKESRMDTEHKLLSLKTGTIAPHPTNPEKIVMTTLEINSMGGMPTWALHWMMRAVAPSMMKGLETRYIAAARNKGDVVDGTPKDWVSGGKGDKKNEGKEPESKSSHK
jgi:hypothetical protein